MRIIATGLTFPPEFKTIAETSCSLKQVRYAVGSHLYSPGAFNLPSGVAVGSIEGNQFKLHFRKPGRNLWRPEFKGSFSATNDHVTIVVRCGLSTEASFFTYLYLLMLVCLFVFVLKKSLATHVNLSDFYVLCSAALFGLGLPSLMFWNEFRYDKDKMTAILSSAERAEPGENE